MIVVGAGPAGSTAAYHLAAHGTLDVLVVDRSPFPRHKTCGGALLCCHDWPAEFPNYAAIQHELKGHPVASLRLYVDRDVWWEGTDAHLFDHVQRHEFDDRLLRAALARPGVWFRVMKVKTVQRLDNGWIRVSDSAGSVEARVVIGADGVASRVSRALGNPARTAIDSGSCLVHDMVCDRPHETAVVFYLWGGEPGYGYLFPTADGYCVGVGFLGAPLKRPLVNRLLHRNGRPGDSVYGPLPWE